jgi:hypothetical protein
MKLVTNDYGCGTSSSILDYGIQDVVVVSEENFEHVFEADDDLLFIGHDFLFYLWCNEELVKRWQAYVQKHELWVWCFERIDAIVPQWQAKSHYSLHMASKFCKRILACDEDDCDKYGLDWLPQWASPKFFEKRHVVPTNDKILFSGQAGGPEYKARNDLLQMISADIDLQDRFQITNTKRTFSWEEYVDNLLKYPQVLNPVGILKGLNTRAYEVLYSNRLLLQHAVGNYPRHEALLRDCSNAIFFRNFEELKTILTGKKLFASQNDTYTNHSLYARLKLVGIEIK